MKKERPDFSLPPPLWAFGHHATIARDLNTGLPVFKGLKEYLTAIPGSLPLEGIVIDDLDLEHNYAFTLDRAFFEDNELDLYHQQGFTLTQVSGSGFPSHGRWEKDAALDLLNGLKVQTLDSKDYKGQDENGEVVYTDYSKADSSKFVTKLVTDFVTNARTDKSVVGVQLKRNEVSKQECKVESCFVDYQDLPAGTWYIHKPGNLDMTINTFF